MKKQGITAADRIAQKAYEISSEGVRSQDVVYMAAPLCHAFFPYSNPGPDVDFWQQSHGNFHLTIEATSEINPETRQREKFGLPYGPKPRLMLAFLNTVILKQKSPEISVGNSLTEFIGNHLKMSTDGRTINEVKNQLARLSTSLIKATYELEPGHTMRDQMSLIRGIDVWWHKNSDQRHLWGNFLRFSDDYFNEVMAHGVPLDSRALSGISGNALALDVYCFLAHRLHNIPDGRPLNVSWKAIKDQIGQTYARMDKFKQKFRYTLQLVRGVYPDAKIEEVPNRGFILRHSKPPIPAKTSIIIPGLPTTEQGRPLIATTDQPFNELYLKKDPHEMSPRKADQIVRTAEGKWDGQQNNRYKDVTKRKK